MKIKKAELRKGLAQLPINYPAPTVEDVFDYESEKHRVENLCKKLSHNEAEVRDAVLADLPRYLKEVSESYHNADEASAPKREDVELLLQKLCLGIFYCFWHSDKPLVQHECAFKISQLFFAPLSGEMQLLFAQAMFHILAKHWGKIDHYRMDKYLALVRKMVYQLMSLCKVHHDKFVKENAAAGKVLSASRPSPTELCTPVNNSIAPFAVQMCTFLQDKVLECPSSVGLTMHLMDLFLDELIRSDVPVDLFVYLSEQVPLFVMSKGNFVEKRVLDNFVTPVVSGVLDERRVLTLSSSPDEEKRKAIENKKAAAKRRNGGVESTGARDYSSENDAICLQLANCCRDFSVRRGTKFFVRTMFVESQKLLLRRLEVKLNPLDFKRLTKRDMQARIADEIREQEETADKTMKFRKLIKDDFKKDKLDAKKIMKKQTKRQRDDEDAEGSDAGGSDNDEAEEEDSKKKQKRTKKARVEKDPKSAMSKKELRALKKKKAAAPEPSAPVKKVKAPKVKKAVVPVDVAANLRPGVKKQLEKMKKKAELMDARRKKIDAGERESKVSVKGVKQSSKRSKYVKMTTRDILEEAAKAEAEDAGPPPTRF